MKNVVFLCDWGESPLDILNRYKKQTPRSEGVWKGIRGVSDINEADYFIVLDGLKDGVNVDIDRSIFIRREPDFIKSPKSHCFKHSIDWTDGNCGIVWWLSKTYDELLNMDYPEKNRRASCVVSAKHVHRLKYVKSLYQRKWFKPWEKSFEVDLYGKGHESKFFGESYKGEITSAGNCKLPGLLPYQYSLVLENSVQKNYWTEKLADAYLSWCVPLYYGCPNIDEYFDPRSIRKIDPSMDRSVVEALLSESLNDEVVGILTEQRLKILNDFNIWEVVQQKVLSCFE